MSDLPCGDAAIGERDVVGVDCHVPLADGSLARYINFDNAASTPALRAVLDAVIDFMPWYSSVHRGAGYKSQLATGRY
jgi:cysteine desulfurase / selenocysteine lyase